MTDEFAGQLAYERASSLAAQARRSRSRDERSALLETGRGEFSGVCRAGRRRSPRARLAPTERQLAGRVGAGWRSTRRTRRPTAPRRPKKRRGPQRADTSTRPRKLPGNCSSCAPSDSPPSPSQRSFRPIPRRRRSGMSCGRDRRTCNFCWPALASIGLARTRRRARHGARRWRTRTGSLRNWWSSTATRWWESRAVFIKAVAPGAGRLREGAGLLSGPSFAAAHGRGVPAVGGPGPPPAGRVLDGSGQGGRGDSGLRGMARRVAARGTLAAGMAGSGVSTGRGVPHAARRVGGRRRRREAHGVAGAFDPAGRGGPAQRVSTRRAACAGVADAAVGRRGRLPHICRRVCRRQDGARADELVAVGRPPGAREQPRRRRGAGGRGGGEQGRGAAVFRAGRGSGRPGRAAGGAERDALLPVLALLGRRPDRGRGRAGRVRGPPVWGERVRAQLRCDRLAGVGEAVSRRSRRRRRRCVRVAEARGVGAACRDALAARAGSGVGDFDPDQRRPGRESRSSRRRSCWPSCPPRAAPGRR